MEKIEEYNDVKRLGELFANDLIQYQKLGGNMNNLTATNVYRVINGESEIDDLSKILDLDNELNSLDDDSKFNEYNNDIKEKLESRIYNLLFVIIDTKRKTFDSLSKKQKIRFIKEGYKYIEILNYNQEG